MLNDISLDLLLCIIRPNFVLILVNIQHNDFNSIYKEFKCKI